MSFNSFDPAHIRLREGQRAGPDPRPTRNAADYVSPLIDQLVERLDRDRRIYPWLEP